MVQVLSNNHDPFSTLQKYNFKQEVDSLFLSIKELKISILKGGEEYLYKFLLTYVDKMENPSHLVHFLAELRDSIGTHIHESPDETYKLYHLILCEFIDKKRSILLSTKNWDTDIITFLFYFFREVPQLPETFLNIMSQLICASKNWKPIQIATILRMMEGYRDTLIGKKIIQNAYNVITQFYYENYEFTEIQSLVIALEHHDIEIPIDLLNCWNTLQNEESHKHYTQTKHEKYIFDSILTDYSFEGYSLEQNVYICGYEVDIVMYDIEGKIFAIIESDGKSHDCHKTQKKDKRRDELFLRKDITDIIIRCGIDGNRILCKEENTSLPDISKSHTAPLNPKKLTGLQAKFAK